MPRYIAKIRTPKAPAEAFAFMADIRNFEQWDPGISKVVQVEGEGPGADAAYDVTVVGNRGETVFRYETTDFEPPRKITIVGRGGIFTSIDEITVTAVDGGSEVTYDADLRLPLVLRIADPLLRGTFKRIGDKAMAGMEQALDGTWVRT